MSPREQLTGAVTDGREDLLSKATQERIDRCLMTILQRLHGVMGIRNHRYEPRAAFVEFEHRLALRPTDRFHVSYDQMQEVLSVSPSGSFQKLLPCIREHLQAVFPHAESYIDEQIDTHIWKGVTMEDLQRAAEGDA